MTMLPKRIHRLVEWHLRNAGNIRANAFAEAEALRKKANTQPPAPEVPIKGKGKHGDATGRKAQLLAEADRIMRQAPMWEAVARDTEAWCARTPSLRRFYGLYYSMGLDYGYIARGDAGGENHAVRLAGEDCRLRGPFGGGKRAGEDAKDNRLNGGKSAE